MRREVLDVKNSFNGQFQEGCQKHSVPPSLLTLLGMVMKGPTTKCDHSENQACLSIAQLVVYNSVARARQRSEATGATHHIKSRECPLPIYTALKLHGATRDKALMDSFYNLGVCMSYDRLMSISIQISNSVLERYERDGVVCPPKPRKGLFTSAAVDNIDHNPSSTTSQGSFHGTAISLVQHPTNENPGQPRNANVFESTSSNTKSLAQLPLSYCSVDPGALPVSDLHPPEVIPDLLVRANENSESYSQENDWLCNATNLVSKKKLESEDFVSWAAFSASQASLSSRSPAIISLLPMFTENAHTFAMILHSIKVVKSAVQHVNPSQIPVVAFDQPLFAIAKQIQWTVADYGESSFVCMFGGLHIEMAVYKMLGKWIGGSSWTDVLVNAGVATQGVADLL